jgi:hypothetical protein
MCEILHSTEFHHFDRGGDIVLFDVGTLSAIDSCELDRVLLDDAAAEGRLAAELFERGVAKGFDPLGVRLRLRVLREQRFLLAADESTPRIYVAANVRADCRACWSRNLCAGGPASDCAAARSESEAAIAIYARHFRNGTLWRSEL